MLGLSKIFIIVLFIAAIIGYGTKSFGNFMLIVGIYIGIRIIYNILS